MIGIAPAAFAEGNAKVSVDGFGFEVTSEQKAELIKSRWAHAFRLEDTSNRCGDSCHTGFVGTDYYISSPDMSQEYIVRPQGLERVVNPEGLRYEDDNWGDYGYGQSIRYSFGYDSNDNVFVVVYGK